jgi:hypothetical protein
MTQEYVASQMSTVEGISWTSATVSDIELGRRDLRISELMVLSVVISTPIAKLCPELAELVA